MPVLNLMTARLARRPAVAYHASAPQPVDEPDMWIFGYGSLMWKPGFEFVERHEARIHGYQRDFCIYSRIHRGTWERPGLVLGLDTGGSCHGVAYRVADDARAEVAAYLKVREQPTAVYHEVNAQVTLLDDTGRSVDAMCYVADHSHEQYAGKLPLAHKVELILNRGGKSGTNLEYVQRTVECLDELGIRDDAIDQLWRAVVARRTARARAARGTT